MDKIILEKQQYLVEPQIFTLSRIVISTKNMSMDFVSQEHGVPHDGLKDSNAGVVRVRSWIAAKHGDRSLETPESITHCRERHRALPRFRALVVR
jgi:hypothetical protein